MEPAQRPLDAAHLPGAILRSTDDAVFGTAEGVILTWNHGAERLYGYGASEAVGRHVSMLAPPERRHEIDEILERLARGEHIEAFKTVRLRKDGRRIDVSMTVSPIFDEKGRVIGAATVAQDVTEHKKLDDEVGRLNDELRRRVLELTALSEELEAFSYSVSHDLRAPLGRIAGFSDLLLTHAKGLDAQGRHFAEVIARSARQMNDLIRDLLEFSRMSRGEARMGTVDLDAEARSVIRELEPETAGRRVAWRVGKLPRVYGDAAMLRVVLQNLLSNAVKFTRLRKDAVIEVGCARGCADQEPEAVLFIRDNGAGFDMGKAGQLFAPFHRLHDAKTFEGTGVGLATVRRIMLRHGGRVWAESRPELGATFYFSLPRAPRRPPAAGGERLH